jgi:hypothetical protein
MLGTWALKFSFNAHSKLPLMLFHNVLEGGANLTNMEFMMKPTRMGAFLLIADKTNKNLNPA